MLSDCDLGRLLADHLVKAAADVADGPHIIVCTDAHGFVTHIGPFVTADAALAQAQACADGQRASDDTAHEVRCVVAPLFPLAD